MAAYFIYLRDEMLDPGAYAAYGAKAVASFSGHEVKAIVANGALTPLEGESLDGVVILEFPSVEAAKAWYHSDAYQGVVGERLAASRGRAVIVEGLG